jgi:CHAT domain-containing protein/Tfp pilus assembly protein PilF
LLALAACSQVSEGELKVDSRLGSAWCIEAALAPGETDSYSLTLPGRQYLRLVTNQWGIDLTLSIVTETGSYRREVNGQGGKWVKETLSALTEAPGDYQVSISAPITETAAGRYRLQIEEIRPARARDTALVSAETALHEARHQLAIGNEDQALVLVEKAIDQWSRLSDPKGEARAYYLLGKIYRALDEYKQALTQLTYALSLQERDPDSADIVLTLLEIGTNNKLLESFEEALRHYQRALELASSQQDRCYSRCLMTMALNNLALLYKTTDDLEEAQEYYEQALVQARDCGDPRHLVIVLSNLGALTRDLGDPERAFEHYREALQAANKLEDASGRRASLLNNIGVAYRRRGELQKALETYTQAFEAAQAQAVGKRIVETIAATNLGHLYSILGEEERAGELFDHAQRLWVGISPEWEAWVLRKIGWFHESNNRYREALAAYESALEKDPRLQSQGNLLQGMGRTRLRLGEAEKALDLLRRALRLQIESRNLAGEQSTHNDLGDTYIALEQLSEADEALQNALRLAQQLADPYREMYTRSSLANLARAQDDLDEALYQRMLVLEAIESLRMEVAEPEYRASFLSRQQDEFVEAVDLLMELHRAAPADGHDRAAFAVAERARARSLVELLTEVSVDAQAGVDPQLLAELQSAGGTLIELQSDLTRLLAAEDQDQMQIAVLSSRIDQARKRLEEAESELRKQNPRYAEIRYPDPIDQKQVRQLLDEETALLEYVLGARRSYLYVLTRERLTVEELPPAGELHSAIQGVRAAISRPGRRNLGRLNLHSHRLYKMLIEPAETRIADIKRLIIAPDQELFYLPFETLVINQPTSGRPTYLIDRWSASYAPSGSVLNSLAQRSGRQQREGSPLLVALADPPVPGRPPLPSSRQEISRIAELLPADHVSLRVGAAASELFVKQSDKIAGARFVHLACHGLLDEKSPANSALQLAADRTGQEDGLLQVHEIFSLRLSADMVVLSACESGLGKHVRGEGLVGLSQAFLFAGAHSVVVSLWPVADYSTEGLMVEFYTKLLQGSSRSEALRLAKLALLDDEDTSHPFYWAPFILIGE